MPRKLKSFTGIYPNIGFEHISPRKDNHLVIVAQSRNRARQVFEEVTGRYMSSTEIRKYWSEGASKVCLKALAHGREGVWIAEKRFGDSEIFEMDRAGVQEAFDRARAKFMEENSCQEN